MKNINRPLAVTGFTFFITGSLVLSMPMEYTVVLLALFALFVFIHYKTKKVFTKQLLLMLFTAVIATVYVNTFACFYQNGVDSITKDKQTYMGYVSEVYNSNNTSYKVALLDENCREIYNVSIYYHNKLQLCDVVQITDKFKPARSDKYIFSSYADNIKGSITVDDLKVVDKDVNTVKYKYLTAKNLLLKNAQALYDNEFFAIVSAMGYNDGHYITKSIKSLFKIAGLSHVLVVSGLHVGIIMLAVQWLLKHIPISKKIKNIITAVIIIAFMQIIGLSASVIRAGMLVLVVLLCRNIKLEQDSLTTLALIGMLCTLQNPFVSRDIGAMLSYAASVGIVLANGWCKKRNIKDYKRNFACAVAAVLFTMPVLALAGMDVTLLSPIFNLIFGVFVTVICVLSVFTPIISLIPIVRAINPFLVITNKLAIEAFLTLLALIEKLFGFAVVNLAHPAFICIFIAALAAYFVAYIQMFDRRWKNIFILSVSISAFVCYNLLNYNILTITAFDSGREGSFHISVRGKEYLVLTEDITADEAEDILVSANKSKYEKVYYCPKEFKIDIDMTGIADKTVEVNGTKVFDEQYFVFSSDINGSKKLFTISAADCDVSFGHGKVVSTESEYYFLGNDKPKDVAADEIYIFGSTPSWMETENINNIDSEIKIKINLKTGKYKTVKDVFNFGYRL